MTPASTAPARPETLTRPRSSRAGTLRTLVVRLLVVLTAVTGGLVGTGASPAHADRCEPEELVLGPDSSPIHEDDHPACAVLFTYVYPFICAQPGQKPPPGLLACPSSIRLNPNYRPPLIPPYRPDTGRLVCNIVRFASPTTDCRFDGDELTGDTLITTSDFGSVTIPGTTV